jgi:capsular polysaccharide biosynthesis protein
MSTSENQSQSGAAQLAWSLRNYAWLVALCAVALGVLLPVLKEMQPVSYEARALVVTDQLQVSAAALPRFGDSVFRSGAVARAVSRELGGNADKMIPDRLDVVAPQDSVVFQVIGRDEDPVVASRLANSAAKAFLVELNKPGSGVGTFSLQDEAGIPMSQTVTGPGLAVSAATGVIAGAVLGFGLVLLVTVLRRPVIGSDEVEPVLGVPVLGSVLLPRSRASEFPGPRGVPGIASVTRWLVDPPAPRIFITSSRRAEASRQRISVMLATALSQFRPVGLQGAGYLSEAMEGHLAHTPRPLASESRRAARELLVVDGTDPLESIDPAGGSTVTILVVREGTPRHTLRAMAAEYLHDELLGVVIFRRSRRWSPIEHTITVQSVHDRSRRLVKRSSTADSLSA